MNLDPLNKLHQWLSDIPDNMLMEIISIAGHFHPEKEIYQSTDLDQVRKFMTYIDSPNLGEREVVIRSFLISRLIDFAFLGRDSEEGWQETYDRNLLVAARLQSKRSSTQIIDNFFKSYDERKSTWIKLSNEWYVFRDNQLNIKDIADWYFSIIP